MIKYITLFLVLTLLFAGCVERYYLEDAVGFEPKVVINALITDDKEEQEIIISMSSNPEEPEFLPVSNCNVIVEDREGNLFIFSEKYSPGHYNGTIDLSYFYLGNGFKIRATINGELYESEFEDFLYCPPVDSIYYELESRLTSDSEVNEDGAQFFVDFKAPDDYGAHYMFEMEESWEYHSSFEIDGYFNGSYVFMRDDYSLYTCYNTRPVNEIFTLSTKGFKENTYIKYKLHFVNDHTQRLLYQYSILLKQYSLTEKAHYFWERLRENQQESGSFFDKQPSQVKGNVYCVNNPDKEVLGYFGVSSVNKKRIVLEAVDGLSFKEVPYCDATWDEMPMYILTPEVWPVYFVFFQYEGREVRGVSGSQCFNCLLRGGVLEKPSYFN